MTDAQWLGFRLVRPATLPSAEEMYRAWNNGVALDPLLTDARGSRRQLALVDALAGLLAVARHLASARGAEPAAAPL